jgi:flagellar hook-associated protein 2
LSLSSLGIGSGLDIRGLVDQLVAAERQPVETRLARREIEATTELSAFSRVSGALSSLDAALGAIDEATDFDLRTVATGDEDALGVTVSGGAALGAFQVVVERIAQRQRLGSVEQAAGSTFGGTAGDGLTFTVADETFSVDLSAATDLAGVRDAIVEAAGGALSASLVTTDDGSQALVLNASDTGEANAISIAYEGTLSAETFGFTTLNRNASGDPIGSLSELDARIIVDGFAATRSDNRITDVLEGVSFDLRRADPGAIIEVAVASDVGTISSRIGEVVTRYNALLDTIEEVTAFGGETGPSGVLIGDATIRALQSRVRDALGVGTAETSALGISSTETGRLEFESGTFVTRLTDEPEATATAVTGENGLITRLRAQVQAYSGSEGLITARTEGLDARIDDIAEARLDLEERLVRVERRLVDQFSALDALVAQLNTTGSFLTQQLDNLPGFRLGDSRR